MDFAWTSHPRFYGSRWAPPASISRWEALSFRSLSRANARVFVAVMESWISSLSFISSLISHWLDDHRELSSAIYDPATLDASSWLIHLLAVARENCSHTNTCEPFCPLWNAILFLCQTFYLMHYRNTKGCVLCLIGVVIVAVMLWN